MTKAENKFQETITGVCDKDVLLAMQQHAIEFKEWCDENNFYFEKTAAIVSREQVYNLFNEQL